MHAKYRMRGTVAHGAAFSKHFAAFTLAPEGGGAPGRSAADDDENARQLESSHQFFCIHVS